MKAKNKENGILSVASRISAVISDSAVPKVLERAVVAAKRENVISSTHAEEGAVAGAAHEAIQQIVDKCVGLNLGGKIGIARHGSHIGVCVFFAIGLLNLTMSQSVWDTEWYNQRRMVVW